MKNVHVLPTENESRIRYNSFNKVYELCEFPRYHTDIKSTHHIYITSDEEIKEGEYQLYNPLGNFDNAKVSKAERLLQNDGRRKKIILTTDVDLIEDGAQAIDDDFLEWFVKNQSCESVEVEEKEVFVGFIDANRKKPIYDDEYKIIIPKEEPTIEEEYLKDELKKYDGIGVVVLNKPEEPKQDEIDFMANELVIEKERMYSEESECVNMYLDDLNIPRKSEEGQEYSIVGRIKLLESRYLKQMSEVENYYLQQFNKNNCKHENVKREDGLDECLDCGIKNY